MLYHPDRKPPPWFFPGRFWGCAVDHRDLRELFRHLQSFEALFETEGIDTITGPDGTVYTVFDLRRLYDMRLGLLAPLRARAIELFLYRDMREQDAAREMGLGADTPVAIYATQGLKILAAEWESSLWRRVHAGERSDEAEAREVRGAGGPGGRADPAVSRRGHQQGGQVRHPDSLEAAGSLGS
jgi:hypothetical protein